MNKTHRAIVLTALLVLSTVAFAGIGTAAEVQRGGENATFNPGVGGPSNIVVSQQKSVVFRGEDGINFVDESGASVDPGTLVGVAGDAEGQPLELPVPEDQALGQYTRNGQASQAGVTVQQPRVTDIDLYNERGVDVSDSSIPEDERLLVGADWNFQNAEDLDIVVEDENGNEITGDVLTSADQLSDQQRQQLNGPYQQSPDAVGNPGQRGTGTEQVYLQGVGQFNQSQLANTSLNSAFWAIDLSDQDAGQYTIRVEGWDNLDFGTAARSATVDLTTDTDITLDLGLDQATRGQYVPFTIRGSTAGATHFVTIEDSDFRNNQVDERVFRDVQDVRDRGIFDQNGDGTPEFAYAEVVVDEDTGLGQGQIDTTYLDDTNVDVNVYQDGLSLDEVSNTFGDPEDDDSVRVEQGQLSIDHPAGTYIAGQEVDVSGFAQPGIDDVALYARDQGDWELLDVSEDGTLDDGDLISVDADGEWEERDVRLSQATDILAIPGRYRFGVIESEDARDENGNLRETLTTSEFSSGTSEQTSILVTEPSLGPDTGSSGLGSVSENSSNLQALQQAGSAQVEPPGALRRPLIYQSYNGQVATEDGTVDVLGTAPGEDDVLLVLVDTRGRVATEQVTVDDDDLFDEDDVSLTTIDGRELNEGTITGVVYALGRDGVAGDGIVPGETDADLSAVEDYIQSFSGTGLTQQQVLERFMDETTNEAGSDDLTIRDSFRYTDGATNIQTIRPASAASQTGINPVQPGDTMVVSGVTNRKPDDNTISVDVTGGPDASEFDSEAVDEWNYTGQWQVTLDVPENVQPGTYTVEADDGDNTDIVNFQVARQGQNATTTPGNAETSTAETETPAVESPETETAGPETGTAQTETATQAAPIVGISPPGGNGGLPLSVLGVLALIALLGASVHRGSRHGGETPVEAR